MRTLVPSSRRNFRVRFSTFDVTWAVVAPLLALYVRDALILYTSASMVAVYCSISLLFSLIGFAIFRISDGMSHHFSVYQFVSILKAVIFSELLTSVVLFTFTRLEGVPRSTPLVHALILAFGLILARAITSISAGQHQTESRERQGASENIIIIGMTRLSSLYIELLAACSANQRRVIGVLDERSELIGHSMAGAAVVGPPQQLGPVVDEFEVHGICTHRVIVGGDENFLPTEAIEEIRQICASRAITLDFIPDLIGLRPVELQNAQPPLETVDLRPTVARSSYFLVKRSFHFLAALALVIILLPLWILISGLVLIDVGMPIFFWQQRVGLNSRPFLLYKFRTMRPPFDWRGAPIPEERRTSAMGYFLRESRLDELPQLLNILVGDMDLVGPRPLLPRDQPENPTTRLTVRPGITGWAQINGGTTLTPDEKDKLDAWYIRNASLWLDLRISVMTFLVLGERRRQAAEVSAQHPPQNAWDKESVSTVPSAPFGQTKGGERSGAAPRLRPLHATIQRRVEPHRNS